MAGIKKVAAMDIILDAFSSVKKYKNNGTKTNIKIPDSLQSIERKKKMSAKTKFEILLFSM